MPIWILNILAKKRNVEYVAYYDNDLFVGISLVMTTKTHVYLWYLSVNDEIQGKGYGSKILQCIHNAYPNKIINLDFERIKPNTSNYQQRLNRAKFYEKNGYLNTNYYFSVGKKDFSIYSYPKQMNKQEIRSLYKDLFYGVFIPKLNKEK